MEDLEVGSLAEHHQVHNGPSMGNQWLATSTHPETRLYSVSFHRVAGTVECPVEGCGGLVSTRTNISIHFVHHHVQETIVIIEEGNLPHPHCPKCDMLVPWAEMKHRHHTNTLCMWGSDRNIQRLEE